MCYPNNFVVYRTKNGALNVVMVNLLICLVVAACVIGAKYFGGKALEVLNTISEALKGV